jgi:hypothetical protein
MGNIFQYAVKILTVTAKLVIAALTNSPAQNTPPKEPVLAKKPIPPYEAYMEPTADQNAVHIFKTSDGTVYIFSDSRSVLP